MHSRSRALLASLAIPFALTACGGDDDGEGARGDGGDDNPFGNPTDQPTDMPVRPGLSDGGVVTGDAGADCSGLRLVIRDFTEMHPDFEHYTGDGLDGIVAEDLGSDRKPVYAHPAGTEFTTSPADFLQWYRDVPGVNQRVEVDIRFTETSPGQFTYENGEFFPIDGRGFGNGPNGAQHNYLFTTEAHTVFTYEGGEEFTFRGDDDLWVFVNGKLAVDLGGLHPQQEETIDFDQNSARLGIEVGQTYPMDIFHAERHTDQSNFRIQTTIDLSCIQNIPVD